VAAAVGVDRFLTEIKTTGHLKHPHILPLFDSGSADDVPFYVMPFIDGESLRARLRRAGRLPVGEVVRILHQLADALAHAPARGVIHRDVKPDNVLVSDRRVFLADFGVARALTAQAGDAVDVTRTGTGVMLGTPASMAPEQIVGGPVDHRTDIYAFGALAYELLTGRHRLPARRSKSSPRTSRDPLSRSLSIGRIHPRRWRRSSCAVCRKTLASVGSGPRMCWPCSRALSQPTCRRQARASRRVA
jgi:serine/threonine protein kinase